MMVFLLNKKAIKEHPEHTKEKLSMFVYGYTHAIAKNYVSNITVIQKRRKGDVDATGAKRRLPAPQSYSNKPKSSSGYSNEP